MILVTRINKLEQFYVNENLIEFIEETPDTIISLESGKKIVVLESADEIIKRIIEQERRIEEYRHLLAEAPPQDNAEMRLEGALPQEE